MAPIVSSVWVDKKLIDNQNSFLVTATCQDCDLVFVHIDNVALQMEPGPENTYHLRVHAVQIQTSYTGDVTVYAIKVATDEVASGTLGSNIMVSYREPFTPGSYMVEMYKTYGQYKTNRDIKIIEEFDERRVNLQNDLLISVKEGDTNRDNRAQDRYKDLIVPLIVKVSHPESYRECRRLFEEHVLYTEEYNANLDGEKYDRIRIMDDGRRIPAWNTYTILHTVQLKKYLKKVEIAGE